MANGEVIPNLGQRNLQGYSADQVPFKLNLQVTPVKKVLTSVAKTCDAGNVTIFTKNGDSASGDIAQWFQPTCGNSQFVEQFGRKPLRIS